MYKKIFFVALILLFCCIQKSSSQNAWNLQKCIEYAIANNLQLKQSQLSQQTAKVNNTQAKLAYIPNFSGDATQYYSFGRALNLTSNTYDNNASTSSNSFSFNGNLPIFSGLIKYQQLKQSEYDLNAAKYDVAKM